jgi:hypothetical protein
VHLGIPSTIDSWAAATDPRQDPGFEGPVGGYGDLPQNEGIGINAFERMLLLFSDSLLEGANRFVAADFDRKGIAKVVALNQTVEFKSAMS